MIRLALLCALLLAIAAPVHAMSEQAATSTVPDQKSQYADPDDAEEQFSDAPRTGGGVSGREETLLGGQNQGSAQTYGFSSGYYGNGGSGPGLGAYGYAGRR